LTSAEVAQLNLSQIVIGSEKHRDLVFGPYAFTEQNPNHFSCNGEEADKL
jgi:hypothetical protein